MGKVSSTISSLAPILSSAGGVFSVLPAAAGAINAISGLGAADAAKDSYLAQQDLALKQLQQSQRVQMRGLEEQAALDRAKVQADADAAEQSRLAALRRAVARQRAQSGVSGISSDDSSPQAVLLGLYNESDDERAAREQQDAVRSSVIDQGLAAQQRANILETAQLQERQKLARLSEGY
jgi:hypothetical protein